MVNGWGRGNRHKGQPRGELNDKKPEEEDDQVKIKRRYKGPKRAGADIRYVIIRRPEEVIRVYRVDPGEDLDVICSRDRVMADGSYLRNEGEMELSLYKEPTLERVRSQILHLIQQQGHSTAETERQMEYPRKPLMRRTENKAAYAVLDRELILQGR